MHRHPSSAIRRIVRRVHLWLGLSLGLLFAVIGITGSALVFYTDIDAMLNPVVQATTGEAAPARGSPVWDRALATGRAARPHVADKWTFEVTGKGGPIPARYYPRAGHHADREMLWFAADGTRIVRAVPWGGYAMSWLYQLHMQLLAGDTGHQVVGWSGVAMLALLLSGLYAWWPRGRWRKALAFKRDAVPIRRLRDLHKLSGLWSFGLLAILVATGVLLALPDVTRFLLAPAAVPAPVSTGSGRQVAITRVLDVAQRTLPDGRITFFDVPETATGTFRVRFAVPGDPHARFPGSYVFVDQYSGRVLAVHDVRRGGTGTAVAGWVRVLHDGSVGGIATRILAVLMGLVPAVLCATGTAHWLTRRRRRR